MFHLWLAGEPQVLTPSSHPRSRPVQVFLLGKERLVSLHFSDPVANLPQHTVGTRGELPPLGFIALDRNLLAEAGTGAAAMTSVTAGHGLPSRPPLMRWESSSSPC